VMPPGPAQYRQPSVVAFNYNTFTQSPPQQTSPPQQQPYPAQPFPQHYEMQQQYFQQPSGQTFEFSQVPITHSHPSFSVAPRQQFAAWAGYGSSSGPDTLDEENAVPPKTNPWKAAEK
jgi:hypothetical protein